VPVAVFAALVALLAVFAIGVLVGRRRERRQIEARLFGDVRVRVR
jgi:hypothetical protein